MSSIGKDFLETAIRRLMYYKDLGEKAMAQLSEEELQFAPNSASNSISVIVQHMAGNMLSRWTNFLTEDGEKEWRRRDAEFEEQRLGKEELMALWERGWDCFLGALQSLRKKDLRKTVFIRKEPLTVVDAINRQLAHYPYHIGQIVFLGKLIRAEAWQNLSIPKGASAAYNAQPGDKDPARKY